MLALSLAGSGCAKQLPPPAPPPPSLPSVVEENGSDSEFVGAAARTSEVTITTDVPALVERSALYRGYLREAGPPPYATMRGRQWTKICDSTPCTVRLDRGSYVLHFLGLSDSGRISTTTITVGKPREVINHTLGQERASVGTVVGAAMIVAGLACMIFPFGFDLDQRAPTPAAFVGVGVGAAFGGMGVMALDPMIKQHGATTQWSPQDSPYQLSPTSTSTSAPSSKGASFRFTF